MTERVKQREVGKFGTKPYHFPGLELVRPELAPKRPADLARAQYVSKSGRPVVDIDVIYKEGERNK